MAADLRAAIQKIITNGGDLNSVASSSGYVAGDWVFAYFMTMGTITPDANFIEINSGTDAGGGRWWYGLRKVTGSEPANYTFVSTTERHILYVVPVKDADSTTPQDIAVSSGNVTASAVFTFADPTPTIDGGLRLMFGQDTNDSNSLAGGGAPAGATGGSTDTIAGNFTACCYYQLLGVGTGGNAQGTKTWTLTNAGFGRQTQSIVRPAAGGGGGGQVTHRDGIAVASLSAFDGIAKASISHINGLTI